MTTKTRILIVDDDPDTLALLESILSSHGYEVTSTSSGTVALDLLRAGLRPCLILIDLEMPIMNGEQVRLALTRDAALKDIPVVITSASREHLQRLGHSIQQLTKPFTLNVLIQIVEKHCSLVNKE